MRKERPSLDRCLVLGGTLPTLGGFRYGTRFEGELLDPGLGRTLRLSFDVVVQPTVRSQ